MGGVAVPPLGEIPVPRVDGAAGERHVSGEEPAARRPLQHENLKTMFTVPSHDHR